MLVPKGQKVNMGNPVELRIKKCEDIRSSIISLQNFLAQYSAQVKILGDLERKITKELLFFYQGDNVYAPLIHKLSHITTFREELFKKEINLLDKSLSNVNGYEKSFNSFHPFIKNYYKNEKLLEHYERKLPKVMGITESRRIQEGQVSKKDAAWIMRNQKKLEDARVQTLVSKNNIIELSDKVNLERFDKMNPLLTQYLNFITISSNITTEKFAELENYDEVLKRKESTDFNPRFFVELDKDTIERFTRSQTFTDKSQVMHKSNVQNNYYYVNDPNAKRSTTGTNLNSNPNGFENNSGRNLDNGNPRLVTSMADGITDAPQRPNAMLLSENIHNPVQGTIALHHRA